MQLRRGLDFEMPRNEGVISVMTWLTRLSAKVAFSYCLLESCEVAGEEMSENGQFALVDDGLWLASRRAM
jgi:hypothetical protein